MPSELGLLTALEALSIRGNEISGQIPSQIGNCQLFTLQLSSNALTGPLPTTVGLLTKLRVLSIERNTISGYLPSEIGNLGKNLRVISAAGNNISGNIPSDVARLTELRTFDLEMNKLSGRIPDLSQLSNLNILLLSSNSLTGPIPTYSLSGLVELETFLARGNELSGPIPTNLGLLSKLQSKFAPTRLLLTLVCSIVFLSTWLTILFLFPSLYLILLYLLFLGGLDLSFNKLSGWIPTEIAQLTLLRKFHFLVYYLVPKVKKIYVSHLLSFDLTLLTLFVFNRNSLFTIESILRLFAHRNRCTD